MVQGLRQWAYLGFFRRGKVVPSVFQEIGGLFQLTLHSGTKFGAVRQAESLAGRGVLL